MKLPSAVSLASLPIGLRSWLSTLVSSVSSGWNVEHLSDGRHAFVPTDVPYSAAAFSGDGTLVWTVPSQVRYAYTEIGKLMTLAVTVTNTTVSGTGRELRVTVPNGRLARHGAGAYALVDNAVFGAGLWISSGNIVSFYRADGGNWAASAAQTNVYATCVFEVQ